MAFDARRLDQVPISYLEPKNLVLRDCQDESCYDIAAWSGQLDQLVAVPPDDEVEGLVEADVFVLGNVFQFGYCFGSEPG